MKILLCGNDLNKLEKLKNGLHKYSHYFKTQWEKIDISIQEINQYIIEAYEKNDIILVCFSEIGKEFKEFILESRRYSDKTHIIFYPDYRYFWHEKMKACYRVEQNDYFVVNKSDDFKDAFKWIMKIMNI